MTMLLVGGFGIVIAVNFYMASHAISGFGGVVVPNGQVCLQVTRRVSDGIRCYHTRSRADASGFQLGQCEKMTHPDRRTAPVGRFESLTQQQVEFNQRSQLIAISCTRPLNSLKMT